jgi:endogenous inhibitor of DNA gyrase (YacG/DUF329 family)
VLVLHARPDGRLARRCPECGRPCPRYDKGKRRRCPLCQTGVRQD